MVRFANASTALALALGLAAGLPLAVPTQAWAQDASGIQDDQEDHINTLTQRNADEGGIAGIPAQPMVAGGCPVGSAYGEPNNMGRLTQAELALFQRWDFNADGTVSVAEQTQCLGQVGMAPTAPDAAIGG